MAGQSRQRPEDSQIFKRAFTFLEHFSFLIGPS